MKFLKTLLIAVSMTAATAMAAVQTIDVRGDYFTINTGSNHSVDLGGWMQVQKLMISAEGLSRDGATFEVVVNGETKGTIYVPGRDPSYVVTVAETAKTVEFRHTSGGSAVIKDIKAVITGFARKSWDGTGSSGGGLNASASNSAVDIAIRAMDLVDTLQDYVDATEFLQQLLPIKKAAGRVKAKAHVRGDLSRTTGESLMALGAAIDAASDFMDRMLSRGATFELSIELLSLQEEIKALTE